MKGMHIPPPNLQHYEAAGLAEVDWNSLPENDKEWPACAWCGSPPESLVRIMDSIFGGPFHLVQCRRCGLRFIWPRPKEAWALARVAELISPIDDPGPSEWATRYYNHVVLLLCAHPDFPEKDRRDPKIFDAGCGRGHFLKIAWSRGWKILGCDRNPLYAGPVYGSKPGVVGLPFQDVRAERIGAPFDAVTMLDYLEHSYAPFSDLRRAADLLLQGGLLVVKTFLDELDHDHKMLAPPVHLYHFTEDVLLRMIQDTGFVKPMVLHDGPGGVMVTVIAERA